jgi:hypothetical protein
MRQPKLGYSGKVQVAAVVAMGLALAGFVALGVALLRFVFGGWGT